MDFSRALPSVNDDIDREPREIVGNGKLQPHRHNPSCRSIARRKARQETTFTAASSKVQTRKSEACTFKSTTTRGRDVVLSMFDMIQVPQDPDLSVSCSKMSSGPHRKYSFLCRPRQDSNSRDVLPYARKVLHTKTRLDVIRGGQVYWPRGIWLHAVFDHSLEAVSTGAPRIPNTRPHMIV
jgi:hypothetical protein